jgi:rhomboid protease GluP
VKPCCSKERKRYWKKLPLIVSFLLFIVQIILFIISLFKSDKIYGVLELSPIILYNMGATEAHIMKEKNQYWKAITYIFLHGGFIQILINYLSQLSICFGCEKSWGIWRYLIVYFYGGIIGGIFSCLRFSASEVHVASVGASASICSVRDCYIPLTVIYLSQVDCILQILIIVSLVFFVINFVATSFVPNVDYVSHIGGVIADFAAGMIMFSREATPGLKFFFNNPCYVYLEGNNK